ncbi:MAG: hypothetical protein M3Q40_04285 [Pseudomonadota bacterium]|nr:hypothetical protein [Pseudomonadota bacterium]
MIAFALAVSPGTVTGWLASSLQRRGARGRPLDVRPAMSARRGLACLAVWRESLSARC